MNTAQHRKLNFAYLIVFTLVLTSFIPLSLGLSCQGIFYSSIAKHLDVAVGTISYYSSIIAGSSCFCMPLMGRLITRLDARLCLSAVVVLSAAAFVLLSFTQSLWMYFLGAFILGIPVALLLYIAPSTLVNRWFAKRSGFFVGIIMAFTGIGGVVWSSVGGALIHAVGWSTTYLVFAGLCLLTLPFTIMCVANNPQDKGMLPVGYKNDSKDVAQIDEAYNSSGVSAQKAFKMPSFYLILGIAFLLNFGMYIYFVIPSYAATIPLSIAFPLLGATASSAAMAGQTLSKLLLGSIGEKHSISSTIVAVGLGIVGIVCLNFAETNIMLFYVGSFAFGVYYGVSNVMLPIFTRQRFGVADYANIYSRISMAATFGLTITGFVWGTLLNIVGFNVMFNCVTVFIVAIIVLIVILRQKRDIA